MNLWYLTYYRSHIKFYVPQQDKFLKKKKFKFQVKLLHLVLSSGLVQNVEKWCFTFLGIVLCDMLEISSSSELCVQLYFLGMGKFLKLLLFFYFIVEIYKKGSLDSASEIITFRQLKLSQTEMANNTGYPVALLFIRTFAGVFLFVCPYTYESGYIMPSTIMLMVILFKFIFKNEHRQRSCRYIFKYLSLHIKSH